MELNRNKIIFLGIGAMIFLSFLFLLLTVKKSNEEINATADTSNIFTIWLVGDSSVSTYEFTEGFKQLYPEYEDKQIVMENFSSYEDYTYTMMSALASGKGPDIFVLNNNEPQSVFSEQVVGVDPEIINPNDFRKKYKGVFGDDLIVTSSPDREFLLGIPVGYETLGVYYNRKYIRDSELQTLSSLNNKVSTLSDKYSGVVPIGIGNGTTVRDSADIATQFFMLEDGVDSYTDLTGNTLKQGLASYLLYGDDQGYNKFNDRYVELRNLGEDSLYLFSRGEVFMVVGYPSLLSDIKENGFSKSYLSATAFPHYYSGAGKTLINYNYFAINKASGNIDLAQDFLSYLSTDTGANAYLDIYPYYLPALLSLESDKLEDKIDPDFNITLGDFYNEEYELSSFNKGIKNIYDNDLVPLLDNSATYESLFEDFRTSLICKTNKIVNFTNLGKNCD